MGRPNYDAVLAYRADNALAAIPTRNLTITDEELDAINTVRVLCAAIAAGERAR